MGKLTNKQDLFAKHYAMGKSGKQSAILAGYSRRSAQVIASENLTKSEVLKKVESILNASGLSDEVLATLKLSDTHSEEVELDDLLAYGSAFIRTCDLSWYDGIFDAKMKYQRMIFPSGVKYHYSGFSNSELGLPFELIATFATKKSTDVGQQVLPRTPHC